MNSALRIQAVHSRWDWRAFIRLPWRVNRGDPNWVPPLMRDREKLLDASRNPFFEENPAAFFLAVRDGEPVGRIASMINLQHNVLRSDRAGFFGFMEGIDDREVFGGLLAAAEDWLRVRGCDRVIGPVNPDTNNEMGFLVDGFGSPPFFMMAHNPPYYDRLMAALGYAKANDLYSYFVTAEGFQSGGKLARVNARVRDRYPVRLRTGDMRRFEGELELLRDIYNDAFSEHWGFVPMKREDVHFFSDDLRLILDPSLVLFLEYGGEAVGFLLAVPNINEILTRIPDGRLFPTGWLKLLLGRRRIQGVRVMVVAVRRKYQSFGFGGLFYEEIAGRIIERGYRHAEMSWIMEDNLMMNRAARLLGGEIVKTYRVYQRELA